MPRIFCTEKSPRIFFFSSVSPFKSLKHSNIAHSEKKEKEDSLSPSKPGTSVRKVIAIFPFHSGGPTGRRRSHRYRYERLPHSARTENHAHIASSSSSSSESAHLWWRKEEDCTFSYLQLGGEGGGACEQGFLPPSFNPLLIASCAEPIRQVFPHSFPIKCTRWRVIPQTKSVCIPKVTVSKRENPSKGSADQVPLQYTK